MFGSYCIPGMMTLHPDQKGESCHGDKIGCLSGSVLVSTLVAKCDHTGIDANCTIRQRL